VHGAPRSQGVTAGGTKDCELRMTRRHSSAFPALIPTDLPDVLIIRISVKSHHEKDSACAVGQITGSSSRVPPAKGRYAIVTSVGRGMRWTLWLHPTSEAHGGRQRRVVLISRRWDQALLRRFARRRGLSSPAPRGERVMSRNTVAQGMPECSAYLWFRTRVLFYLAHEAAGATSIRHSLHPRIREGDLFKTRAFPAAGTRVAADSAV
jgi:hypothetical protein